MTWRISRQKVILPQKPTETRTIVQNQVILRHLIHELGSERMSAAERASEASSVEQENKRADEQVAQRLRLDSWLS